MGDDTCVQLASLLWHQVKAVEAWLKVAETELGNLPVFFCQEIHLSHNEVQQKGEVLRFFFVLLSVKKLRY